MKLEPYAAEVYFQSRESVSSEEWGQILARFMECLADGCVKTGPCVIGHIKGLVRGPEKSYMRVSVTSESRPADLEGELPGKRDKLKLTINVIVYGLSRDSLDRITKDAADNLDLGSFESVEVKSISKKDGLTNIQAS
jgi:hypothetical protein